VLDAYLDGKLGGGGVYRALNLDLYHYAGNNPLTFIDPDGNAEDPKGPYYNIPRLDNNDAKNSGSSGTFVNNLKHAYNMKVQNKPPQFVSQHPDPQLGNVQVNRKPGSACGVSSDAAMTGIDVNKVDEIIRVQVGGGDFGFRQNENALVAFLRATGHNADGLLNDWKSRNLSDQDLGTMRDAIRNGSMILYHFDGHYAVMYGYQKSGKGANDYNYFFYDPAGDRTKGYFNMQGKDAVYSHTYLKSQPYFGNAYAVDKRGWW
jgi:hypothetical protein